MPRTKKRQRTAVPATEPVPFFPHIAMRVELAKPIFCHEISVWKAYTRRPLGPHVYRVIADAARAAGWPEPPPRTPH